MRNRHGNDSGDAPVTPRPTVVVIVVNWNRWRDTVECLESVLESTYPHFRIVVVDNHSTDASLDSIGRHFRQKGVPCALFRGKPQPGGRPAEEPGATPPGDAHILLVPLEKNGGYAFGINRGAHAARDFWAGPGSGTLLWAVNNDITVAPSAMSHLVAEMGRDERTGCAGCLVMHFDRRDEVQTYAGTRPFSPVHLPGYLFRGKYLYHGHRLPLPKGAPREIKGHLYGASIMMKQEVFDQVGGWNESYFLEFEDVDFCRRVRRAGYRLIGVADAQVFHKVGASKGSRSGAVQPSRFLGIPSRRYLKNIDIPFYYRVRNEILFLRKNYAAWFPLLALTALPALNLGRLAGIYLYNDPDKMERVRLLLRAMRDAFRKPAKAPRRSPLHLAGHVSTPAKTPTSTGR
ncbi:MAG: glycosyltransferase family 2 protein [Acidobacteria bacterium]|nr:glycosyltransferase family 2 protein [Acidobacteriota bacterium]